MHWVRSDLEGVCDSWEQHGEIAAACAPDECGRGAGWISEHGQQREMRSSQKRQPAGQEGDREGCIAQPLCSKTEELQPKRMRHTDMSAERAT